MRPATPDEGHPSPRRSRRRWLVVATAGVAAMAIVASILAAGGSTGPSPSQGPSPADADRPPANSAGPAVTPAPMAVRQPPPYAGWLAAARADEVVAIDPVSGREIVVATCGRPCGADGLAVSPDGRWLAFLDHDPASAGIPGPAAGISAGIRGIGLVAIGTSPGAAALPACTASPDCYISAGVAPGAPPLLWSMDSSRLAYSDGRRVWTVRPDGLEPFLLGPAADAHGVLDRAGFRVPRRIDAAPLAGSRFPSPVGGAVAWVTFRDRTTEDPSLPDPFVAQLWVMPSPGAVARVLAERPGCCVGAWLGEPVWSPDGAVVAWAGYDGIDGTSLLIASLSGVTRRIEDVAPASPVWIAVPATDGGTVTPPSGLQTIDARIDVSSVSVVRGLTIANRVIGSPRWRLGVTKAVPARRRRSDQPA